MTDLARTLAPAVGVEPTTAEALLGLCVGVVLIVLLVVLFVGGWIYLAMRDPRL